jgi:hypothetical protein
MKLLFIENRYATWVYADVAAGLAQCGHEIHWLVQNPMFVPRIGHAHRLPFPPAAASRSARSEARYTALRATDRSVLHFGGVGAHYAHYDGQIQTVLDRVRPDVVIGEATEFHELLAIAACRTRDLPYLSPNVTRYPADRLAFLWADTLDPIGGDDSELPTGRADEMIEAIRTRRVVPSYMRPVEAGVRFPRLLRVADKLRITVGWLRGERYITPSPRRKLALHKAQAHARARWDEIAAAQGDAFSALHASGRPWVLYALQMQPEGNIDVWGYPWNDQAALVRRAARALAGAGATLVVKPNPKSKYELLGSLLEVVASEPNVIALAHATPMAEVFPAAPLVLAVTGTVLLECVFAGKPVASLGSHRMTRYPGVTALADPEQLPAVIEDAVAGRAKVATPTERRALLQFLHATSYPAAIWDPIGQPGHGTPERVTALTRAFKQVLAAPRRVRVFSEEA